MTAPEIVLIITTTSTGLVSIIGAVKSNISNRKLDEVKSSALQQDVKLDNIHQVANSNLEKALAKVSELVEENQKLREDILKFNQRQRLP